MIAPFAGNAIIIDGKDWREVVDTINLGWQDLETVCDVDTGVCEGSIDGVDFTGWTWASIEDVGSMFDSLIPEAFGSFTELRDHWERNSLWAPALIDNDRDGPNEGFFRGTSTYPTYSRIMGRTRSTQPDLSANMYYTIITDHFPGATTADFITTDKVTSGREGHWSMGHWMYRTPIGHALSTLSPTGTGIAPLPLQPTLPRALPSRQQSLTIPRTAVVAPAPAPAQVVPTFSRKTRMRVTITPMRDPLVRGGAAQEVTITGSSLDSIKVQVEKGGRVVSDVTASVMRISPTSFKVKLVALITSRSIGRDYKLRVLARRVVIGETGFAVELPATRSPARLLKRSRE